MKISRKVLLWVFGISILILGFFLFLDKSKMMSMPIVSNIQDRIIEKQWSHSEILHEDQGSIYTLGNDGKLIKFNIGSQKWESTKSPIIQSERWGISKEVLACFVSHNDMLTDKISLFSVPEFNLLNTILVSKDDYYLPMLYPSKNGKYVAVVGMNKMGIFSAEKGEKIFGVEYTKSYTIDTVDWSLDSNRILFSVFDKNIESESQAMPFIIVYDLNARTSEKICQGRGPKWNKDEDRIMFRKSEYSYSYGDIFEFDRKKKNEKLLFQGIRLYDYGWSPSGDNFLVALPQKSFSLYHWPQRLTVVNYSNPKLKFIALGGLNSTGNNNEHFFWVDN